MSTETSTGTVENSEETSSQWQSVPNKKRPYGNSPTNSPQKENKKQALETSNRYALLSLDNDPGATGTSLNSSSPVKKTKIPPIILHSAPNYKKIVQDLKEKCSDEFVTKLTNNSVKVLLNSVDDYRTVTSFFDEEKVLYHTYAMPGTNKNLSVVIRGIPYSLTEKEILDELTAKYPVQSVTRILNQNKKPTPLCIVHLDNSDKAKSIFELDKLFYCVVKVEPKNKRDDIPMCRNCQRYNHTQKYCRLPSRCVKCKGNHHYSKCTQTNRDLVTCVNCNQNHPANYKGCEYFQKLKNNKNNLPAQSNPEVKENYISRPAIRRDNLSYANITGNQFQPNHNDNLPEGNSLNYLLETIVNIIKPFLPQIITYITTFLSKQHTAA